MLCRRSGAKVRRCAEGGLCICGILHRNGLRGDALMEGIVWLAFTVLTVIPLLKLLPHFGINKYWALACIIPFGVLALIWWMSLKLQELERR